MRRGRFGYNRGQSKRAQGEAVGSEPHPADRTLAWTKERLMPQSKVFPYPCHQTHATRCRTAGA